MKYDPSVKHEIVTRYLGGESATYLSKKYDVSRSTIYRWKDNSAAVSGKEKLYTGNDIVVLERRVKKLENIVQILKTVNCTAHSPLRDRLNELEKLHGDCNSNGFGSYQFPCFQILHIVCSRPCPPCMPCEHEQRYAPNPVC